jgi:hypothetical protein
MGWGGADKGDGYDMPRYMHIDDVTHTHIV